MLTVHILCFRSSARRQFLNGSFFLFEAYIMWNKMVMFRTFSIHLSRNYAEVFSNLIFAQEFVLIFDKINKWRKFLKICKIWKKLLEPPLISIRYILHIPTHRFTIVLFWTTFSIHILERLHVLVFYISLELVWFVKQLNFTSINLVTG